MLIDTHIHTKEFSRDAKLKHDELLSFAENHQPCLLCTTEHYDYDYPHKDHQLCCDPKEYLQAYTAQKARYESARSVPYPILFGIEYGYMNGLGPHFDRLSKEYPFDCVICSIHYYENCDPYLDADRYIYEKGKEFAYGRYLEAMIHALENCSGFDILGHFDYVTRYAPYPDKKMYYRDFPDHFDRIFALCIQKGKALELNTRVPVQLRSEGRPDYLFDPQILIRYKKAGGELISLGSDAHHPDYLTLLFDEAKDLLRESGFSRIVGYKERKPFFIQI